MIEAREAPGIIWRPDMGNRGSGRGPLTMGPQANSLPHMKFGGGYEYRAALYAQAIRGPVLLVTLGALFAMHQANVLPFSRTWPLIIIMIGIMKLIEKLVAGGPADEAQRLDCRSFIADRHWRSVPDSRHFAKLPDW